MKSTLITIVFLLICGFVKASVNEKVLAAFKRDFPVVDSTSWKEYRDFDEASFWLDGIRCMARYDPDGKILLLRRYYIDSHFSPFIKAKILDQYPDAKVYGVTEITTGDALYYYVVLQNEDYLYNVTASACGEIIAQKRHKRATTE